MEQIKTDKNNTGDYFFEEMKRRELPVTSETNSPFGLDVLFVCFFLGGFVLGFLFSSAPVPMLAL